MLIAVCGDIGSGKDTVGDVLVEEFGFTRASFAQPLKEWTFQLVEPLGVEARHIFGGSAKTKQADQREPLTMLPPRPDGTFWTGRALLEYLGTEVGRGIHGDVWVARFVHDYEQQMRDHRVRPGLTPEPRIVITDIRFQNEFDAVRKLGGEIWRNRLNVEHGSNCQIETRADWRQFCNCGAIEATGHASDKEWRFLEYDRLLAAPKPGIEILHARARNLAKEMTHGT